MTASKCLCSCLSLGIPVLVAAGSHTIDHLSSIADGQGIRIKISHLTANPQPIPEEASAARAQRDEIKAIKSKRAKRTSPPNWLHPRDAVSLWSDARDELAYVNKFLSTNYKTADGQRIGVIIHPQHEATFMKVMCIRCSKELDGNAALGASKLWHINYDAHLATTKCEVKRTPLTDLAAERLAEATVCTRTLPPSINDV